MKSTVLVQNLSKKQLDHQTLVPIGPRKLHVFLLLEDQRVFLRIKLRVEHKTIQDSTPKESKFYCVDFKKILTLEKVSCTGKEKLS